MELDLDAGMELERQRLDAKALNLTAKERAAILIVSLGREAASQIYKHLSDEEIEELTINITGLSRFDTDERDAVIGEFYDLCLGQRFISEGGMEYARDVLISAIGESRASEVLGRLSASLQVRPFDFVRKADSSQVLNFIQNEHPQTIALVLAYLDTVQAASILASLDPALQPKVMKRMATMTMVSPEYIRQAEQILERKLLSVGMADNIEVGGIDAIVNILNSIDHGTETQILHAIEQDDPDLAAEIHSKLFVFADIARMSNTAMQVVLRDVDQHTMAVAMKNASEDVKKVIMNNISKRMQEMLSEELAYMGPVRVKDVEAAQQEIVNIIRRLEESGQIIVSRGGKDDDVIV